VKTELWDHQARTVRKVPDTGRSRKQDGRGVLDRILTRRRRLAAGSILKDALKNAFVGIATKKVEEDK
jgi:hypothetical protein